MKQGWNVIIRIDEQFNGLRLWFCHVEGDKRSVVKPIDLTITEQFEFGGVLPEATLRLSYFDGAAQQFLQSIANGLAENGYRPEELKAKDKELEAVESHLKDFRSIIAKILSIDFKE